MSAPRQSYHVLFVDDERYVFEVISRHIRRLRPEWVVTFTDSAERALEMIDHHSFDAVVTDFRMPGTDGLQLLNVIRREQYSCAVIMLTGAGCQLTAVKAMKSGARDYLIKGQTSPHEIVRAIENAIRDHQNEIADDAEPPALTGASDSDRVRLDPTTNLLNRTAFEASLTHLESFLHLTGETFALLRVDIDGFRSLCRLDGMEAGEEALRRTASVVQQATRSGDLVARVHDDTFMVLAIGIDSEAAHRMSTRIHELLRQAAIPQPAGDLGPLLTVSIGAVIGGEADPQFLMRRSEHALRCARSDGPARTYVDVDDRSADQRAA